MIMRRFWVSGPVALAVTLIATGLTSSVTGFVVPAQRGLTLAGRVHGRVPTRTTLRALTPLPCLGKKNRKWHVLRACSDAEESADGERENTEIPIASVNSELVGFGSGVGAVAVIAAVLSGFPDVAAAAAPGWVGPAKLVLDPLLLYFEFAFVARIVLSWYPALDLNRVPQNFVAWPTEPILKPTRAVVPPAFGVDISPIVWVMICSFLHEILLGQQGILNLISNK